MHQVHVRHYIYLYLSFDRAGLDRGNIVFSGVAVEHVPTEIYPKRKWYDSVRSSMPVVPPLSPATGNPTHPSFVHTINSSFVDNSGRTLLLRGVNLSGANKAPLGHLSYILDDFWLSAEDGGESFVGRPLNLNDGSADVHLARLKGWGFNLIRLPFTWESLERQGP